MDDADYLSLNNHARDQLKIAYDRASSRSRNGDRIVNKKISATNLGTYIENQSEFDEANSARNVARVLPNQHDSQWVRKQFQKYKKSQLGMRISIESSEFAEEARMYRQSVHSAGRTPRSEKNVKFNFNDEPNVVMVDTYGSDDVITNNAVHRKQTRKQNLRKIKQPMVYKDELEEMGQIRTQ